MSKKFLTPIDMGGNALIAAAFETLATDPGSPKIGQFWLNTTAMTPKFWSGAAVVPIATQAYVTAAMAGAGAGDMLKAVYDTNNSGAVDAAETAPWAGISGKPTVFAPAAHAHVAGDITNFSSAVAAVKVSNATAADTAPWGGISGKPTTFAPSAHNHVAADISDLPAFVNSAIASVIDTTAGSNDALDTLSEILTRIQANSDGIADRAKRYAQTIGDGSATTIVVTHNLNTRDLIVRLYNATSYAVEETDIVHTTVNTVTLVFAVAPTVGQYRVVIVG